ncbi:MAG: branched-chain amino acid aminotransferase [Chitinophagales bacterium]
MTDIHSNITIPTTKVKESRLSQLDLANIKFGHVFTDHMFVVNYDNGEWINPQIQPFGPIPMHPATSSIHYGQSIFEGMKAHRNKEGEIVFFRMDDHAARFCYSAKRMAMPEIPKGLFRKGIMDLVKLDQAWVPQEEGYSLYIRPYMFATDEFIGIRRASSYKFMIILSPVAGYYSGAVEVYASTKYTRAAPGGTGMAKAAGNYAAAILPAEEIKDNGYDQILWLDGRNHTNLQEIGTMNVFVVINGEVHTPSLFEGTILPGITRDSAIQLLKSWNVPVHEREISIHELVKAHQNGHIDEMFGSGTAATISPIKGFGYDDRHYEIALGDERSISAKLKNALQDIKQGNTKESFGWVERLI